MRTSGGGRGAARVVRPLAAVALAAALAGAGVSGADAAPTEVTPSGEWHVDPMPASQAAGGPAGAVDSLDDYVWTGKASEENGALDSRVPCIGNGVAGKRIEVLYARPSGAPDQYATLRDPIRSLVSNLNREFAGSAGETRGRRQLRLVTDGSCNVEVGSVQLSGGIGTEHSALRSDLMSRGYDSTDRVYLVYLDGDVSDSGIAACGVSGGGTPPFAIISDSCWSDVDDHEVLHAFNAVNGGPHASGDGHCFDGWDPLCGEFSFGPPIYPCAYWHHGLPDCGHDDYFHTNPKDGSYLDKHPARNVANSPFLDKTLPPLNDQFTAAQPAGIGVIWGSNVGATAGPNEPATAGSDPAHSIWFAIQTPAGKSLQVETSASSVDTVLGLYTGSVVTNLTLVKANDDANRQVTYSRVRVPSTAATTYYARVDGSDGKVGSVRLNVLLGDPGELPTITGLSPQRSTIGQVHVDGTNLFGQGPMGSWITFNGNGYASYDGSDATGLKLTPRNTQHPGPVTFTNDFGHVASDDAYQVLPKITSFSPGSGGPGSLVHVIGTGFVTRTTPQFTIGGKAAKVTDISWDWSTGSPGGWDATIRVPSNAVDGKIGVKTAIGSTSSTASFNVS